MISIYLFPHTCISPHCCLLARDLFLIFGECVLLCVGDKKKFSQRDVFIQLVSSCGTNMCFFNIHIHTHTNYFKITFSVLTRDRVIIKKNLFSSSTLSVLLLLSKFKWIWWYTVIHFCMKSNSMLFYIFPPPYISSLLAQLTCIRIYNLI